MERFQLVAKDVYFLKVPFGPVWTGVILLKGDKNILIDSSATGQDVDAYVVPALAKLGMDIQDIDYLVCTHTHGDHIGGHARLRELGRFQVACYVGAAPKLETPVPYAIATRTKFPHHSPAPQSSLQGVKVDILMEDGEILSDRLQLIHTPGHDDDCVCWLDLPTGTLFTGDSLQANGTICQGIGFYKSLPDYLYTLDKLAAAPIKNILCGHDYAGIGYRMAGKDAVRKALRYCRERVEDYDAFIRSRKHLPADLIATELIRELGCGMPEHLFMALYTVTQHLEYKGE